MKSVICNLKFLLQTFGCQMNKLDSALVEAALRENGFLSTPHVKEADVVLINTCSVRRHAEQRVFSHLGHLKHIKESKPDLIVGVIGCMAQRLGEQLLEHDAVDIVCGPAQISQVVELVKQRLKSKERTLSVTQKIRKQDSDTNQSLENFESVYDRADKDIPGQAYVRVMRGCDKFCSYCIVPYVRGPEISRPPKAIIEQVKRLADQGVKLVTLLGQTVNSYEYKAGDKTYCLADLLLIISDIESIEWIRFVTSYPHEKYFNQICKAMADSEKVCNYLHIPAQSGSDKILGAMNRKYTAKQYLELIQTARDIILDIAVAGDFIVGFPGESEEDFQKTVDLVRQVQYKNCFVFKYSPRPGTTADKRLADTIPDEIKKKRNIKLLSVQEKISDKLSRGFLGKQVKVLVEGPSKKSDLNTDNTNNPQLVGRTEEDWIAVFNGPEDLAGKFVNVEIIKTSPLTLFGRFKPISAEG